MWSASPGGRSINDAARENILSTDSRKVEFLATFCASDLAPAVAVLIRFRRFGREFNHILYVHGAASCRPAIDSILR
jgi:hypothetical protein